MELSRKPEQALLAYFSSSRASERHAPPEVIQLSKILRMPVWKLYELSNHQNRHYRLLRIPKQDGSFRELHVPDEALRQTQKAILHRVLVCFSPAESATAYHPGASLLQNAAPHVGKKLLLKTDISAFFDSIPYTLVRAKVFSRPYFSPAAGAMLSALCTLDDLLPQGAPTSPAIANLVMKDFDKAITAWCAPREIAYTRYCDDMAFSGSFSPKEVLSQVRKELWKLGMDLNRKKTCCIPDWRRQNVTGVCVNQRPRLPAPVRRELRQILYYCRKFGPESHLLRQGDIRFLQEDGLPDVPAFLRSLLGKVNFALQIDPQSRDMRDAREWLVQALQNPGSHTL